MITSKHYLLLKPFTIAQPRGFEAAQKSKIQLEAVYTRSTSNVEILLRRLGSSFASACIAQQIPSCAASAPATLDAK